jgi:hypothetical protein
MMAAFGEGKQRVFGSGGARRLLPTDVWNNERRVLASDDRVDEWSDAASAFAWINETNADLPAIEAGVPG